MSKPCLTALRLVVTQERHRLEAMSNCGSPAHLVQVQRQRYLQREAELESLLDGVREAMREDCGASG